MRPSGDLNDDLFLRMLVQLPNTLDPDYDKSPAKIVFGQPLHRSAFSFVNRFLKFTNRSTQRTWLEAWQAKEDALCLRTGRNNAALRTNSPYPTCLALW